MRAHTRHGLLCGPEARKRRAHARKARYRRHWQPPCPRQQPYKRVGPMAGLGAFEWSHLRRATERNIRFSRDERRVGSAIRGDRGAGGQLCPTATTAHAAAPVAPGDEKKHVKKLNKKRAKELRKQQKKVLDIEAKSCRDDLFVLGFRVGASGVAKFMKEVYSGCLELPSF